ncbi:MAG: FmdB family transcriptional regulator [Anaerolineales bacterium]|nr:MAG: FmdB family transcriptional regulator [Anaerolineales bacterium]
MPLYEYKCDSCGVRFERLQHMDEEAVKKCPECGGDVRRLFQPVGIIFKGSGFYVTDHRRGTRPTNPASAKPRKDSSSSTADGSGTSTDKTNKNEATKSSSSAAKSDTDSS